MAITLGIDPAPKPPSSDQLSTLDAEQLPSFGDGVSNMHLATCLANLGVYELLDLGRFASVRHLGLDADESTIHASDDVWQTGHHPRAAMDLEGEMTLELYGPDDVSAQLALPLRHTTLESWCQSFVDLGEKT